MADMGLFGLPFPEEYGGMGGDYFALCLALEELGKVDQSVAITLEAGVSLGAMPVYRFGNDAQKQEWLPLLASGKALGAFGLTEAGGGTDAGATKTTAKLDDGHWVINGTKQFITNSGTDITKLVTVTAVTGDVDGRKQISSILVPVPTEGFTAEPAYDKVGWNASDTHPLSFDDVRVPQENLLGEQGRGYANFLRILDEGRIAIAALSVGVAQLRRRMRDVRQGAAGVRRGHRHQPGHRVQDRPDGDPRPCGPRDLLRRSRTHVGGQALQEGGRGGQAGGQRGGHGQRSGRHPGVRRLRLHERIPRCAALPRQQDPRDRGGGGDDGSAVDADRARGRPVMADETQKRVVVQRGLWFEEFEPGVLYQHRPRADDHRGRQRLLHHAHDEHPGAASRRCLLGCLGAVPPTVGQLDVHAVHARRAVRRSADAGTIVGNLGFGEVAFPKPLFHGDTLYAETEVIDKRESASRPGEGIVTFSHVGRNQHGDVVATASRKTMVRKRPAEQS